MKNRCPVHSCADTLARVLFSYAEHLNYCMCVYVYEYMNKRDEVM